MEQRWLELGLLAKEDPNFHCPAKGHALPKNCLYNCPSKYFVVTNVIQVNKLLAVVEISVNTTASKVSVHSHQAVFLDHKATKSCGPLR